MCLSVCVCVCVLLYSYLCEDQIEPTTYGVRTFWESEDLLVTLCPRFNGLFWGKDFVLG